jgi:hypothetical protein
MGFLDRRGGGRECLENRKKILNSGNEPKNMLTAKELAFSGAKKELVFECKKPANEPKKQVPGVRFRVSGAESRVGELRQCELIQGA